MASNSRQHAARAAAKEAGGACTFNLEWEGQDPKGTTCQPQSMTIWEGFHLIGYPRGSGKEAAEVFQGAVYSVKGVSETWAKLQMLSDYCQNFEKATPILPLDEGEGPSILPLHEGDKVTLLLEDVQAVMRLTHYMCNYTVRGRTL